MNFNLNKYGISKRILAQAALYPNYHVGRVLSQYKNLYKVICIQGEALAQISGKLFHQANLNIDMPAVGDYVMLSMDNGSDRAIIHHILPRYSQFIRKAAGTAQENQIVAANIDTVFICMGLNNDFNLRRLERYLSIAWDSGAQPIVVLTKSDLSTNIDQQRKQVESIAIGADVLVTSGLTEDGYNAVKPYIIEGQTSAFIGSSGVGKSTLINRLCGTELFETNGLRNDDKGRHTTTRRELVALPNGSAVIDTPGMRELGIEQADLSRSFSDIDALANDCRFRDCSHEHEPGCAVLKAVENGSLAKERLMSYKKLKKEAKYDGLSSKQLEATKLNEMFKDHGGMKKVKKHLREKYKNR